jgi:hypothetical protein
MITGHQSRLRFKSEHMKTILINNPMLVLIVMKLRFAFRGQLEHTPASAAIMQFVPTENNAKFCMNAEEDA